MSYDIFIVNADGEKAQVRYCDRPKGAIWKMEQFAVEWEELVDFGLSITYNYYPFFVDVFGEDSIRRLRGMSVSEAIPLLESAVFALGTNRDENYWAKTRGNAGAALNDILKVCEQLESPDDYTLEVW